jgi:hypothetical protein
MILPIANKGGGKMGAVTLKVFNALRIKNRPTDSLHFPGVFPDRPGVEWCRGKALDRITTSKRFAVLRRLLNRSGDFQGYCMAIGYITQNWAMLEQNIDMWVAMIYHGIGGRKNIDPQLPRSFDRKVRFLRKAFNVMVPLKGLAAEVTPLLDNAKKLSLRRNDLVHGAITRLEPVDGKWQLTIFDYESPKDKTHWHVMRDVTFSPAEFSSLERELIPLVGQIAAFGLRLNALLGSRGVVLRPQ